MDAARLATLTDVDALRALVLDQAAVIAQHETRIAQRDEALAERDALIAKREQTIHQRDIQIEALTYEVARLRRLQFAARSERMDAAQRSLFDETMAADIAAAEAQLKASEAQLAQLRHQIDLGRLRAPTDAVVRSRLREPGDMVTSQVPVFTLALTKPKWVRVYVGEPDLGKIKPGMAAQVFTDSHPDRPIAGKVGYISSVAEFTPKSVQTEELRTSLVYEVRVVVEDPGNVLRLGQPATVRLTVGSRTP